MDRPFLTLFYQRFREELLRRSAVISQSTGRFPKKQIFLALDACKPEFATKFTGPVWSRWSGIKRKPSDTKVLEYLLDYSISRHTIPQAIRQAKANKPELTDAEKYGLLLAVESELDDDPSVARDFLKLLDVKALVKLLLFRKRRDQPALYTRLNWVMAHHASYEPAESILLIGLPGPRAADLGAKLEVRCVENGIIGPL